MTDVKTLSAEDSPVLITTHAAADGKRWGRLTLNLPKALNALSLEMIQLLRTTLKTWAKDASIAGVWLDGAGDKAFCAGGDITRLYRGIIESRETGEDVLPKAQAFFEQEYANDYLIHRYPKPLVVWGDGIVMGGGMGLMVGAPVRIVTEKSLLAMPEITIGLYPDIGASYFLQKMPGKLGLFLGLSGFRMNAADALYAGLADLHVPREQKDSAFQKVLGTSVGAGEAGRTSVLAALAGLGTEAGPSRLKAKQKDIDTWMSGSTVQAVSRQFLDQSFAEADKPFADAQKAMQRGSPTSAGITFEMLKRSQGQTLEQAFQQELILSIQCCRHHDFAEGVRALLIDKDNQPRWEPATLDALTREHVEAHFTAPWANNPLAHISKEI